VALAFGALRRAQGASMASRVGGLLAARQPRLATVLSAF